MAYGVGWRWQAQWGTAIYCCIVYTSITVDGHDNDLRDDVRGLLTSRGQGYARASVDRRGYGLRN